MTHTPRHIFSIFFRFNWNILERHKNGKYLVHFGWFRNLDSVVFGEILCTLKLAFSRPPQSWKNHFDIRKMEF